ncbi:hypothetical protein D9M69_478180 [compost metagenome]
MSRRAIWLPWAVHAPQKIQQPLAVDPSARSWAKPASCSPALASSAPLTGSARSARALPENSWASSAAVGSWGRR